MRRLASSSTVMVILALSVLTGCQPQAPFYLHGDGDMSHYLGKNANMEEPDLEMESLYEVTETREPFSLLHDEEMVVEDITLEQAVRWTLTNSKVMRSLGGQVLGPPESLTRSVESVATIWDPAIVETNPRSGIEAALSIFDAQFSSSVFWEKLNTPRNTFSQLGAFFPSVNRQETGTFQAQLQKTNATGGTTSLTHNVMYDQQNSARRFPSDWNVNLEASFSQPLLQGAGVSYNRIAGPGAIPGFNNGVVIARINTDIALADFERGVRDMVWDVEVAYWELYFAYRNLKALAQGRDHALQTWTIVNAKRTADAKGGDLGSEGQARSEYYLFLGTMQDALHGLYSAERKLRYVMGLSGTDGRLFRPKDEPTTAEQIFDYAALQADAISRRVELRRQRWNVKRRELELISAKNYLLPRLDISGTYRWLGMGDDLIDSSGGSADITRFGSNAYRSMTGGDFQEWQFGITFSMPLGFRKEMAGVTHAQLNMAREKARLQDLELEIVHQLQDAYSKLKRSQVLTQTNWSRRDASSQEVAAVQARYDLGLDPLDRLLDARRHFTTSESAFYRSLVDYNKAITEVHYRRGTLLEENSVYLTEGPWPGKAYFDARRRAQARDASTFLDYGFTHPKVVSRGATVAKSDFGPALSAEGTEIIIEESDQAIHEMFNMDAPDAPDAPMPADGALIDAVEKVTEPVSKGVELTSSHGMSNLDSLIEQSTEKGGSQADWSSVQRADYREAAADTTMRKSAAKRSAAARSSSQGWSKSRSASSRNASGSSSSIAETGWTATKR